MADDRSFVVVPFQRVGTYVGARQALMVRDAAEARMLLDRLARQFPGVALIERHTDAETGFDVDTLIQAHGAVPCDVASGTKWHMPLH